MTAFSWWLLAGATIVSIALFAVFALTAPHTGFTYVPMR